MLRHYSLLLCYQTFEQPYEQNLAKSKLKVNWYGGMKTIEHLKPIKYL